MISPVFSSDDPQLRAWFDGERVIMQQMLDSINHRRDQLMQLSDKLERFSETLDREHERLEKYHRALEEWKKSLKLLSNVVYLGAGAVGCCGALVLMLLCRNHKKI